MAHKELKQWINEKLADPNYGSHQEVRVSDENRLKADYLYKYPDGKAIIIEDKEENDSSIEDAKKQLKEYKKALQLQGYDDFITIAIKDLKDNVKVEVYHNDKFLDDTLKSLKYYEEYLQTKPVANITNDIYIKNKWNTSSSICN